MPQPLKWNVLRWRRSARSSKLNVKKDIIIITGLECKCRKSRDTWSDKFGLEVQNEAGQKKLTEFCQDYTSEYKKWLYIWTSPDRCSILKSDWLYSLQSKMKKLDTVSKSNTWRWLAQIKSSLLQNSEINWK